MIRSDLYVGTDPSGHTAYSWLAESVVQTVQFDIAPLLQGMVERGYIEPNVTLGLIEFGSEAFNSPSNVTFTVANYGVNLQSNITVPSPASQSSSGIAAPTVDLAPPPAVETLSAGTKSKKTSAAASRCLGPESGWWWVLILSIGMALNLGF
jgi:hypothetical protein